MKNHPVRHLTRANDGTLSFSYDGELYTMKEGGTPQKVVVVINADTRGRDASTINQMSSAKKIFFSIATYQ
jgi:hypothetical protein